MMGVRVGIIVCVVAVAKGNFNFLGNSSVAKGKFLEDRRQVQVRNSWYKTITPEENHWLCLDAPGGGGFNGNMLWLWECNGMDSQQWVFDNYQIRYGGDENFCIDAGDLSNGNQLMLWECNGYPQQTWGYDTDALRVYVTDSTTCFDLWEDQQWNGQPLHVWECNGMSNQQWDLWDAPDPSPTPTPTPPTPTPTGPSGTASTTRYWDCSKPTCAWANKCPGSGHDKFASDWNQLFKGSDGRIYGTVASSGSFGMDDAGGACMKCYDLTVKDGPAAGKQLTVMATNYCPDQPTCPAAGQTNPKGQQYHFDLAIPGGGLGLAGKCSEEYGGGDWKVNSVDDCGKLPGGIQSGCNLWYNDLNGMDNPLVDWTEVSCPSELTDRC